MSLNNYSQMQNTLYPASNVTPQPTLRSADGIIEAYGTIVPVDGTAGYITGAIFKKTTGGANTSAYVNEGSNTSSDFNAVIADVPVAYGTAAGRGPSPAIWGDCPVLDYTLNPQLGAHFLDDFHDGIVVAANQSVSAAAALGTVGDWAAFTLTGVTVTTLATDVHGVVTLTVTTDEDADGRIAYPQNIETAGMFSFVAGKKFWMEARIKVDNVTNDKINLFCGLSEEAQMATDELMSVAGGGMKDVTYVGFKIEQADGDQWQTQYNTAGHTVLSATGGTIVINSYSKLGIRSDGETITFYIDGVALADTVQISAANFPNGEEMGFYFAIDSASATTIVASIDWVRIAQEY
jgi:hypothetical protein